MICPLTQDVIGHVPQSTQEEFNAAVENAKETQKTWRNVSVPNRVRYMLKYQELLK
jgi:malonate-semialdehyde dehydrogenase (acetylating)/methylmalonate-semialdehyde dehydrogenase